MVVPEVNAGIGGVGSSAYYRGLAGECCLLGPLRARAGPKNLSNVHPCVAGHPV
jgi:hypothetical protein